jgi:hypothetical protein
MPTFKHESLRLCQVPNSLNCQTGTGIFDNRLEQDALILKRRLAPFVCCRVAVAKNRFPLFRAIPERNLQVRYNTNSLFGLTAQPDQP